MTDMTGPTELLAMFADGDTGWSAAFGGPQGVALLVPALVEISRREAAQLATVRSYAIRELLKTKSLAEVASALGISKQAASKAARIITDPKEVQW